MIDPNPLCLQPSAGRIPPVEPTSFNKSLLVKCSSELLEILDSDAYMRKLFVSEIKQIQASYSSPLNYVGTFVIRSNGCPHLGKQFDISLQEVRDHGGVVFADKDLI